MFVAGLGQWLGGGEEFGALGNFAMDVDGQQPPPKTAIGRMEEGMNYFCPKIKQLANAVLKIGVVDIDSNSNKAIREQKKWHLW
jgi:hypothetical protein